MVWPMSLMVGRPIAAPDEGVGWRLLGVVNGTTQLLLVLAAVFLALRRLAGGLEHSLPGGLFVLVVAATAGLWWLLRWPLLERLGRTPIAERFRERPRAVTELPQWTRENWRGLVQFGGPVLPGTLAVLLTATVFTLPGIGLLDTLLGWLMAIGSEAAAWLAAGGWRRGRGAAQQIPIATRVAAAGASDDEEFEELLPENVTQQLTRLRLADGVEAIEGLLRCTFAAGEQMQVVHLAFCPPLQRAPELQLDQLDGPEATLRPTTVESFGARLEIRLSQPEATACDVVLRFYAEAGSGGSSERPVEVGSAMEEQ